MNWFLVGFLSTLALIISVGMGIGIYFSRKRKALSATTSTAATATPPATPVAGVVPPIGTVAPNVAVPNATNVVPPLVPRFDRRYVGWPLGVVLVLGLSYVLYSGYEPKHLPYVIAIAVAVLFGLRTHFVRRTNKFGGALFVLIVGLFLAFCWTNPSTVNEFLTGTVAELGKKGQSVIAETTKGMNFDDLKPIKGIAKSVPNLITEKAKSFGITLDSTTVYVVIAFLVLFVLFFSRGTYINIKMYLLGIGGPASGPAGPVFVAICSLLLVGVALWAFAPTNTFEIVQKWWQSIALLFCSIVCLVFTKKIVDRDNDWSFLYCVTLFSGIICCVLFVTSVVKTI